MFSREVTENLLFYLRMWSIIKYSGELCTGQKLGRVQTVMLGHTEDSDCLRSVQYSTVSARLHGDVWV